MGTGVMGGAKQEHGACGSRQRPQRRGQKPQELTWGQEDAGTGLGGVDQLAEPLRVSGLDVLRPEPGDREGSGWQGATGCHGVRREGAALTGGAPAGAG